VLNLDTQTNKSFLNAMSAEKVRLPEIKRIKIDKLTNDNSLLNDFFAHCVPNSVELFNLNRSYHNDLIKTEYYLDSLCRALKGVSKQAYIENLDVSKKALEEIVKASCGCEQLVVRYLED
jgi:hypothetical protein